ncbi:hypothetical protein WH7805_12193 [Synechococcus sp. WH 7805]|nr:hypothetical protein WH7805_12193 [Synechococcus sp. WH 7805]
MRLEALSESMNLSKESQQPDRFSLLTDDEGLESNRLCKPMT